LSLPGATVCPIRLTVSSSDGNSYFLSWSAYQPVKPGSHYRYYVEFLDAKGSPEKSDKVAGNTFTYLETGPFPESQIVRWRIRFADSLNTDSNVIYSNVFTVKQPSNLTLPDLFTPNADGINDVFLAYGKFIKYFDMEIFNRWGQIVYHGTSIDQGWDGIYGGSPALIENYVAVIKAIDETGEHIDKRVSFLLVR
jgi:gliding motility-associated-like protein